MKPGYSSNLNKQMQFQKKSFEGLKNKLFFDKLDKIFQKSHRE